VQEQTAVLAHAFAVAPADLEKSRDGDVTRT
jgi:hypothetical protein